MINNSQACDGTGAEAPRKGDWMQVFSGAAAYPLDLRVEDIDIKDIAHSLSMQCRYAGHCLRYYSVAEHSVLMARKLLELHGSKSIALAALLHDAPEAYLVDVPRPIKPYLTGYRQIEGRAWAVVAEKFGVDPNLSILVQCADEDILWDEREQNMAPSALDWNLRGKPLGVELQFWSPPVAERRFWLTFDELTRAE